MHWQAYLFGVFWRILFVLFFFYYGRKLFRVLGNVLYQLREHFVLWNVAFGAIGARRNISHRLRLHAYVCKTSILDNASMQELFVFGKQLVETDISLETFRRVVTSYKFVIVCREKIDGSMRGMCLLDKATEKTKDGQKYTLIKMGLALFEKQYQGGPLLYYVMFYNILKELVLHPRTPLYILVKCFSYKSYIAFHQALTKVYPSHSSKVPEFERKLMNEFAASICRPGEVYHPDTFIIEREISKVKGFVAPITADELKNPHIKFFIEQNPNWSKGHCMICLATVTKWDLLAIFCKAVRRAFGLKSGKRNKAEKLRKSFDRHLSFQCEDAKEQVLEFYDLDARGNVISMFGTSADIYAPSK